MHTVLEFEELAREFLVECGPRGPEVRELLWKAQKLVIYLEIKIEKFYSKFGVKTLIENKFEVKKQLLEEEEEFKTIAGYNYQMFAHLDSDLTKFEFENFSIENSSKGGMLTLPRKIENELSDDEGYLKKIANIKHFEYNEFNFLHQLIKNFLRNCQGDSDPASEKNFLCGRGATLGKLRTVLCLNEKSDYFLDMIKHISNNIGLTHRYINLKDISSTKGLGQKLEFCINTLSRVIVLDCFEEFESLIKLIHDNNYNLELAEYYLKATFENFNQILKNLKIKGFIVFCVLRGVDLKNEFLNKMKNLFDFFQDFSQVDAEKRGLLDNYIEMRVGLLKEKHFLSFDESKEFEKRIKSYATKKAIAELTKFEKIDYQSRNIFLQEFNKRKTEMDSDMPKIPKVNWEDIGGLHAAKQDIIDTI
jgi:hypothetical protein